MGSKMFNEMTKKLFMATAALTLTCQLAHAGGTTGGGGNVQEQDQVHPAMLIRAVEMSKGVVKAWLYKSEDLYRGLKRTDNCDSADNSDVNDCEIYSKLFDGDINIYSLVEKTEIETRVDGPCLDFQSQPNDGSVIGKKPGTICISISNIKEKLRSDNYQNQIAALIVHELSHLAGTNEKEADRLQWYILTMDLGYMPWQTLQSKISMAEERMYRTSGLIKLWAQVVSKKTNFNGSCAETEQMINKIHSLYADDIDLMHFILLSPRSSSFFWGGYVKIRAAWNYMCAQDMNEDIESRNMSASIYKYAFDGRDQVTAIEYGGGYSEDAADSIVLKNITAREILNSEAAEVATIFDNLYVAYKQNYRYNEFITYK